MKKNLLVLLLAIISFTGKSIGQDINPCSTAAMYRKYLQENPKIADIDKELDRQIKDYITHHADMGKFARKTSEADPDTFDIPLVVHVIHDYGTEDIEDNKIYELVNEMNKFYSLRNDVGAVVTAFKPYIGNARIKFHLATKDPFGNDSKGITRRLNYLTYGGDDQAKFDQWSPSNYINIWFVNVIGEKAKNGIIVAYATPPATAAAAPYRDGIIANASFVDDAKTPGASGSSIDHEMGHILNLSHTFGKTNDPGTNKSGACTDDDDVDDTPPTDGCLGCCLLNDTICSQNYFKIYNDIHGADSLANYPDTANEQNIMNYAYCKLMFTKGQVARMHAALNNDIGGRDSLWTATNLARTGALLPVKDLAPVTDFSSKMGVNSTWFTCPGTSLTFKSMCWQDTVVTVNWSFTNGATNATATASEDPTSAKNVVSTVVNAFTEPGWVKITLAATGNNSGTTTTEYNRSVFVADKTGTSATDYFMEFNSADTAKWPLFNYYNNNFKWQYSDAGMYDNSSIMYTGFDGRGFSPTGTPLGDYDDMYTQPFDLTSYGTTGSCNLNFFYSGASRTANSYNYNDSLDITYSTDHGISWKKLDVLTGSRLANKGAIATSYKPTGSWDWSPMTIAVPAGARTNYTVFRFRFRPSLSRNSFTGTIDPSLGSFSTSNNFYMDRIHFSQWPAEVSGAVLNNASVKVVPNPTNGDAYVMVTDANCTSATIIVSDITGKQVYTTTAQLSAHQAAVVIPHSAIPVAGMYLVQTITGDKTNNQKLIVY